MTLMNIQITLTNATGRQAASLARAASAVGFRISAHISNPKYSPLVAQELSELPNITIHTGPLSSKLLREAIFKGSQLAFINTTTFDDEFEDGKACIDDARAAGVKFVVYSSMPDHSVVPGKNWASLPHWSPKWHVEQYAMTLDYPVTFVYTGIYHNNFTSLPYPLFSLKEIPWDTVLQWDGDWEDDWVPERDGEPTRGRKCGFEWQAPFPTDLKVPLLDCEHDFGPAVLQIFKDGPEKWAKKRVPLAFTFLDPPSICAAFSRGLNRPVRYVEAPVEVLVPVPPGYRGQLEALQGLLGGDAVNGKRAPFWWDGLFSDAVAQMKRDASNPDEPFNTADLVGEDEDCKDLILVARRLWGGWRDAEGYAREAFPVEERHNRMTWMDDESQRGDLQH